MCHCAVKAQGKRKFPEKGETVVCPWSTWLCDKEWCGTECREVVLALTAHCM